MKITKLKTKDRRNYSCLHIEISFDDIADIEQVISQVVATISIHLASIMILDKVFCQLDNDVLKIKYGNESVVISQYSPYLVIRHSEPIAFTAEDYKETHNVDRIFGLQVTPSMISDYLHNNATYDHVNLEHKDMIFNFQIETEDGERMETYAYTYYDKRIYVGFPEGIDYYSKIALFIDEEEYEVINSEIRLREE